MRRLIKRKLMTGTLALALLSLLAPGNAGAGQGDNASRADQRAYGRLKAGQRTLFDSWAAEQHRAQSNNQTPAALYAALTPSQRTTYEAVTHALSQTRLTDEAGRPLRQNALALVTGLTEIAGEMKGVGGNKQFRLYVQLAPDTQEVLTQAREFFRDKDNTVFHREYPNNFRQRGRTPTLQFSITKDGTRADIDVDYRSSRVPKALVNGHLRAANSDVRAGRNYFGHIGRWFGLLRWWRFGFDDEERTVAQAVTPRSIPASSPTSSSAPVQTAPLTAQQLADARQVAAEANEFLTAWLLRRDASRADDYLTKRPVACLSVDEDEENEVVTSTAALRNFAQLLAASLRAKTKRAALADAVSALEPWDPELVFAAHPYQQLFALRAIQRDEAAEFMCARARLTGDPHAYGEFYATYFTLKLGRGNDSGLALLWTKEDGRWQIVSYELLEP